MAELKQQFINKLHVVYRNLNSQKVRSIEVPDVLESFVAKKIAIPIKGGIALYRIDEIYYCEAQGNYTRIYFSSNNSILLSKTIKAFENNLPANVFFRCHQSYIINKNHVRKYTIEDGLVLDKIAGLIPVSRRKRKSLLIELSGLS